MFERCTESARRARFFARYEATQRGGIAIGAVAALILGATPQAPPGLDVLIAKAQLKGPATAWCRAEFRAGHPGAFAVALASGDGGGHYVALESDGRATELARYSGRPDLACYTSEAAEKLGATIRQSDTIHGHVTPRWKTTVVCGFTDDTSATCWQYSPSERTFTKVGAWVT